MLIVQSVAPGSPADIAGIEASCCLVSVNREPVRDFLDFEILVSSGISSLQISDNNGREESLDLDLEPGEHPGLFFELPEPRHCGNNCLFCFIHQLPRGMRRSLYIKDEDYRFSYLYGSYITLTNLTEVDIERIITQQLSPLYISVHATNQVLRDKLLGRKGVALLPLLSRLTEAGIVLHTQIVLCPGLNDKAELNNTIRELAAFYPGIRSLAVVPVGLTDFRRSLPELRLMTEMEALQTVDRIEKLQKHYLDTLGTRFVFTADELYLKSGVRLPLAESYEAFDQLENGVGMLAQFKAEAEEVYSEAEKLTCSSVSVVTGCSPAVEVSAYLSQIAELTGLDICTHIIQNNFFGDSVTVTGLLTAADILKSLKKSARGSILMIPDVLLRDGEDVLLDDCSVEEIGRELAMPVRVFPATPWGFYETLEEICGFSTEVEYI